MIRLKLHTISQLPRCAKRYKSNWASSDVRAAFLDFFKDEKHEVMPSASIIPTKWRNISPPPFVNAGMVRWRPLIMNDVELPKRFENGVANSQRCIRVGGKDCDLEQVGHDGHHLTFFEMLGSWSFNGSYGRERAIKLAWDLVTNHLSLPEKNLFITYFGGCERLGLPPDNEAKEAWLSIGVDPQRLLPFSSTDNFWQIGLDGPCGPCTEIHFSHADGLGCRDLVNAPQNNGDVVELWNLVFMEHHLHADGSLSALKNKHVDTGMGLERLTAILNGSKSNYDTDLFLPLFDVISHWSKAASYAGTFGTSNLDSAYRILADHIRMATVCLSDGLLPDSSPKLRQVFRKAMHIQKFEFGLKDSHAMIELTNHLAEVILLSLRHHYPDFTVKADSLRPIIEFEVSKANEQERQSEKAIDGLVKMRGPGIRSLIDPANATQLLEATKIIDRSLRDTNVIDGDLAFKIMDSTGLSGEALHGYSQALGITVDLVAYEKKLLEVRNASKLSSMLSSSFGSCDTRDNVTDDSFKYEYRRKQDSEESQYVFPVVQANVLDVVEMEEGKVAVLLDKTCCYGQAGGQEGDSGALWTIDGQKIMTILDTQLSGDGKQVWHIGEAERSLHKGFRVKVHFGVQKRIELMQNHTATHLLNCVLRQKFPFALQKSSSLHPNGFKFDFVSLNSPCDGNVIMEVEQAVCDYIQKGASVERVVMANPEASFELESLHQKLEASYPDKLVITMPEESYPEEVAVICLPDSVEPCCGTHLFNTADVQDFVITSVKSTHPGVKSLFCVTGKRAIEARQAGIDQVEHAIELNAQIEERRDPTALIQKTQDMIRHIEKLRTKLPYYVKEELTSMLKEMTQHLKSTAGASDDQLFHLQDPVLVGALKTAVSPKKINKKIPDKPFFVLTPVKDHDLPGDEFIAVCKVPLAVANDDFNSETWLKHVLPKATARVLKKEAFVTQKFTTDQPETLLVDALLFAQEHIE